MRKRGTYGLTNTIHTNKIGSFLPNIILGSSALLLSCSPGFQACVAAGSAWFQANSQTPQVSMTQVVGPWGMSYTGRAGTSLKTGSGFVK